jgi:transmembrane sensor
MTTPSELANIEDEAATWAVLLADDPDDEEQLHQFTLWLNSSAKHAQVWERTCLAYEGMGQLPPTTEQQWPKKTSSKPHPKHDTDQGSVSAFPLHKSSRSIPWKRSLISLAVAVCLIMVILPELSLMLSADHITGTGKQKTVQLEDGSQLFLAPESAVDIDYSQNHRQVHLLRGIAYLEVARNPKRPFNVDAGSTQTTVLGTAFNVKKHATGTVVSVAHGQVQVTDDSLQPQVSEILGAGDQLAVVWGDNATRSKTSANEVDQWRRGELIARDLTVEAVVAKLRPYYNGVIVVTEPFASQRVTGLYRLDDPVATLTDMAAAHNASATQISPWMLVLR